MRKAAKGLIVSLFLALILGVITAYFSNTYIDYTITRVPIDMNMFGRQWTYVEHYVDIKIINYELPLFISAVSFTLSLIFVGYFAYRLGDEKFRKLVAVAGILYSVAVSILILGKREFRAAMVLLLPIVALLFMCSGILLLLLRLNRPVRLEYAKRKVRRHRD